MARFRQTPSMVLISEHYRIMGLDQGWPWGKVEELAKLLGVEVIELFALVGAKGRDVNQAMRHGRIPTPIALHFHYLREWHLHRKVGKQVEPAIPLDLMTI
jgi:hypothetical protein